MSHRNALLVLVAWFAIALVCQACASPVEPSRHHWSTSAIKRQTVVSDTSSETSR